LPQKNRRNTPGKPGVFPPKKRTAFVGWGKFNLYGQSAQDFFATLLEKVLFDEALLELSEPQAAVGNGA
jgi:hypothetical protein